MIQRRLRIMVYLQGLSKLAVAAAPFVIDGRPNPLTHLPQGWVEWSGIFVVWIGIAYGLWATHTMGGSFTIWPSPKPGGALVTAGPFRYTRNPIYFSVMIMGIGYAMTYRSWSAAALMIPMLIILFVKVRTEEGELERQFGRAFVDYRAHTSALIPWFKARPS